MLHIQYIIKLLSLDKPYNTFGLCPKFDIQVA